MKKRNCLAMLLCLSMLVTLVGFFPTKAQAAWTEDVWIDVITPEVQNDVQQPEVRSTDENKFIITDVDWKSDFSNSKAGKYITCTIEIEGTGDFALPNLNSKDHWGINGPYTQKVSSSNLDGNRARLTFKYGPIPIKLEMPEDLRYTHGGSTVYAKWDSVKNAKEYDVEIFQDDRSVHYETVDTTKLKITRWLNPNLKITYKVRARSDKDHYRESDWSESSYYDGDWYDDYWEDWDEDDDEYWHDDYDDERYYDKTISLGNGYKWQRRDRDWYYYHYNEKLTGWHKVSGYWYYMDRNDSGRMVTGEQNIRGKEYYFNRDGQMQTGWKKIDGEYYYYDPVNESGAKLYNQWIDGYWIDGNGRRRNSSSGNNNRPNHSQSDSHWRQIHGDWYYYNDEGEKQSEWVKPTDGYWYYLDPNDGGRMVTGEQIIHGCKYLFNEKGQMQMGWKKIDGDWYYYDKKNESGARLYNQWIDGYWVDEQGRRQ